MDTKGVPKRGTEITDDQGTYLVYEKHCKLCSLQLTSRNRHQLAALCKPCGASKARDSYHSKPTRQRHARPAWVIKLEQDRQEDPERLKAHALLDTFLKMATFEGPKKQLQDFLMTYEIKALMRNL